MLDFYTFAGIDYNSVLIRGYKDGKQITEKVPYKPFLFMQSNTEEVYRTVDNKFVKRLDFDSIAEAREFTKTYGDMPNFKLYGLNHYQYVYLYEMFKNGISYNQNLIKILNFDIETDSQDGFGNIQAADKEIISVSMKLLGSKDIYVLGLKEYTEPNEPELKDGTWNIKYIHCVNEKELLTYFIEIWKRLNPDAITGWNIQLFDIPYIIKRITYVLSESHVKMLSPFGRVDKREVTFFGNVNDLYDIVGIPDLDYMQTYKKFSFTNEESYALNYLSDKHLKLRKLDYSEYGSLAALYRENFTMFIDYNIIDIVRVEQLNDKLKYFDQIFAITYESLVNYADTFTTIRTWDVLIHNHLIEQNIVVPFTTYNSKEGQIAGGYVKEPQVGKHKWVMSYDFSSLYPHETMTFNISPETYVGDFEPIFGEMSVEKILDGQLDPYYNDLRERNITVTGRGTMFDKSYQGFVPAIMQKLFNRRKEYQKIEAEAEAKLSAIKTELYNRGVDVESI